MCQAYEGERDYILGHERWMRERGYNAQKACVSREANPERDHENQEYSDKRQWWLGWDTAAAGRDPW